MTAVDAASRSLAAQARALFCVGVPGSAPDSLPLAELRAFGPGGITLFARNVGDAPALRASVAALRDLADPPPLIAIDQEGGRVERIVDDALVTPVPSALALGALGDAAVCERLARTLGADLAELGISVDFAPCADLALDPHSTVIGTRSFGDDPAAAAELAAAFTRGLEAGGVAAAVKHFPGHGATAVDSHRELPVVAADAATLRSRELAPFAACIAHGASIVMAAHVVYPALDPLAPASLSAPILTGVLRDELGFAGVIATDCLQMDAVAALLGTPEAAVRALRAGADLLLVSFDLDVAAAAADAIAAAVTAGALPLARLTQAAQRVAALRARCARLMPDRAASAAADAAAYARDVAARAIALLRGRAALRAERPVTVMSFEGTLGDGIAADRAPASLSAALRRRRWKSEQMRVALEPDDDDIDLLLSHLPSLGDRNFVIVTRRAALLPAQRRAVDRLLDVVPDAQLVVAREPWDAAHFPSAAHVMCTFGDQPLTIEALADVLSGRAQPAGRLPVALGLTSALAP